jgi:hypothetical protein
VLVQELDRRSRAPAAAGRIERTKGRAEQGFPRRRGPGVPGPSVREISGLRHACAVRLPAVPEESMT